MRKDLDESDLTKPRNQHKSSILGKRMAIIWSNEYAKAQEHKRKPSMAKVIFKIFWAETVLYGLILFVMEMVAR